MTDVAQTQRLNRGDQLHFVNDGNKGIRVKVVTACGTESISTLHPGACLEITVGTSSVNVYILATGNGHAGLRLAH